MMATQSKLSRSRRKERRIPQRSIISLISDEDDEKENSLDSSVDKSKQGRSRVVNRGRRRESTILAGNLSYQVGIVIHDCSWSLIRNIQESVVSATSAEISVIRRPRVTLPQQEVLLEEEEEGEDDFDGGDDEQNSFQSCNSSPTSPPIQHDHVDSRLTEVESQSNTIRRSLGKLEVEGNGKEVVKSKKKEELAKGKRETSGHVEKSLTAGQTGNQTPNFKGPPGTGLFDILNALWT